MEKRKIVSVLALAAFMAGAPLAADKITEQIGAVKEAYADKDYKGALDELEYLKVELQKLKRAEDLKLLPEPLEGWEKNINEDKNAGMMALMGGGSAPTTISADYTKDAQTVTVSIMANSPLINIMGMMINNPAMMASKPGTEPYRYKRLKGMKKIEGDTEEITLLIAGQILVSVKGPYNKERDIVETYLKRIDIPRLKASLL